MADNWPSATLKNGQKLEGYFGVTQDGDAGLGNRSLRMFFTRYPDGSKYEMETACKKPVQTSGAAGQRTDEQVVRDAVELIRNLDFQALENYRLNKTRPDNVPPLGPAAMNEFAKNLEGSCLMPRSRRQFAAAPF